MNKWIEQRPTPIHVRQFAKHVQAMPGRETVRIYNWGYLEGFEISFPEPIPMHNQADAFEVYVECRYNGQPIGQFDIYSLHRNMTW